ncbi:MAG TPA: helix-turn-helix domain-containing protein [Patescibacteria group bacterium]|nr:helix-turn-helix domain-containing protein [Patescibacteria group bacterium]
MLFEQLKILGFDEGDVAIYVKLLETGSTTVGKLSQKLGQPRSSLYVSLARLNQQGLVTESLKMGVKVFTAEKPEKINLLYEQKILELQNAQSLYKKILPDLLSKQPTRTVKPRLQLFEGKEGLKQILKDMLLYYNLDSFAYWPIKSMVEVLGKDFFAYLNVRRIKQNIFTRAIWPAGQVLDAHTHPYLGTGIGFKREIRIAPKDIEFEMGYWGYANKIAFISSSQENIGFIIESQELKNMLLTQFEVIWKIATPISFESAATLEFLKQIKTSENF